MITLKQKQEIILAAYREGKSQRAIARETGIDRKTIRKYIKEYESNRQELIQSKGNDVEEIIENIVEKPKYNTQNRKKIKLTEEVRERIIFYLDENEKRKKKGQYKQLRKRIDIHEALVEEGIDIGYTTVCQEINNILDKKKEAYIKGKYLPGEICEFDWGTVKLTIGGEYRKFPMAVFCTANGNYRFGRIFTREKTECFQEAHAKFFKHIGGNHKTIVYDNMKVAVKRFVGQSEKEPTEALLKLSIYYGFNYRFCNEYRGNEKGHVERSVEYVRRKAFSKRDTFETLEQANEYLQEVCNRLNNKKQTLLDNKTAAQMLEEEREYLLAELPEFECAKTNNARVNKYSIIQVDSCFYSVPDNLVNKILFVKTYSTKVKVFHGGIMVAEHKKAIGFNKWVINLDHYLRTLNKKPGALPNSVALSQADQKIQNLYNEYYKGKEKDFVDLLLWMKEKDKSFVEVEKALNILMEVCPFNITTEKIKMLCEREIILNTHKYTDEIHDQSKVMLSIYGHLLQNNRQEFEYKEAIV
ncbi:MAG: IS21 family transposase [Clostridia bacterium]|nr:IS21 family transposase [Clostridia bacterium]